jgi:hypothetical protein
LICQRVEWVHIFIFGKVVQKAPGINSGMALRESEQIITEPVPDAL